MICEVMVMEESRCVGVAIKDGLCVMHLKESEYLRKFNALEPRKAIRRK